MDLAITVIRHQTSFPPGQRSTFGCVLLQSPGAKSSLCWVSKSKHKGAGYFAWDSHSQALWAFSWSETNASGSSTQLCMYCKKGEHAAWEMLSTSPQTVPNSRQHVCSNSSACTRVPLELFPSKMSLCPSLLSLSCQCNLQ